MSRRTLHPIAPLLVVAASTLASADTLVLTTDVPAALGGSTYLANQTVRHDTGVYSLEFDGPGNALGPAANIDALVLLEDGSFLFSTDAPFESRGEWYEARDVVRFDQGLHELYLSGAGLGLSPGADIDALARDDEGRLIVSLEQPEIVGTLEIGPSDLVLVDGTLSILVAASDLRLPDASNVVGLERVVGGELYMMFDTPTTIGTTTYLPGEIARLDGLASDLWFSESAMPPGAAGSGFSFPPSPGEVLQLVAAKSGADVALAWQPGCGAADDYAIYEGALGDWYSHDQVQCSTNGQAAGVVSPAAGDRYFLVVPTGEAFEGSYGRGVGDAERPAAVAACVASQRLAVCP